MLVLAALAACDRAQHGGDVMRETGQRDTSPTTVRSPTADDQPAWAVDDARDFDPLPTPAPGDWLDVHHEFGQSFAGFVRSGPNRPDETRSVLVLQPIGRFDHASAPQVEILRRFTETYFGMTTQV